MNLRMFSKEVDWTRNMWSEDPEEVGSFSLTSSCDPWINVRWSDYSYCNTFDFSTSNNTIVSLRTVYFIARSITWCVMSHHTYVLFRELRLFVSGFPGHLCPLLVKDISLLDSVRQRSSGTWDSENSSLEKRTGLSLKLTFFYKKFWHILGQLVVSSSVLKKFELLQTHRVPLRSNQKRIILNSI